jgi:hypothetical protein
MPFKPTQQRIAAAITLFFSVQAIAECNSAPPKTEELDYKRCTTTWTPIPNSCGTLGSWKAPNPYYEGICKSRGCFLKDAGSDSSYCGGIPCCNIGNTYNGLICQGHVSCACIPGYEEIDGKCVLSCGPGMKRVGGKCQEIICNGQHVLGEHWSNKIRHGHKYFKCKDGGILDEWVNCDDGYVYDGGNACWTIVPK